uniref:E3 ubiquitin-protein ligase n=1 Tax=Aegilops tauschii TaxID=37682 RepID=M8CF92_AEGTA
MKVDPNMSKEEITSCDGSTKRKGEASDADASASAKRRQKMNVTMSMDVLDCPICSKPLRPPIYQHWLRNNVPIKMFQCSVGHVVCWSCRQGLPERKCSTCTGSVSERCHAMERVVDTVFVPCKNGCANEIAYCQQEGHERECPARPCICPVPGCGFSGPTAALQDHLTGLHKWPMKSFKYFVPFFLRAVRPGSHVLSCGDGRLFLLPVATPVEPLGRAVSLICVRPNALESPVGCSVCFSCFNGHYQVSSLGVETLSLADGLPTQSFCVLPKVARDKTDDVMLWITMDTIFPIDDDELYEEDDEDDDYEEEDDEDNNDDD